MKLFSAFAASDALEKDRQTVRRALRSVAPDGHEDGQPRWKLTTILKALDRDLGHTSSPAEAPPMHLAVLFAKLDALYAKISSAKSVAQARRILRDDFFEPARNHPGHDRGLRQRSQPDVHCAA